MRDQRATAPPGEFDGFARAVETILAQFVDMAIPQGLSGPRFEEMVRAAYIERAIKAVTESGAPLTPARVAVATGFPRMLVDRYLDQRRESLAQEGRLMRSMDNAARVLNAWHTLEKYSLPYGGAADLPIRSDTGPVPSFTSLVKLSGVDADARDVLTRLVVSGCVQVDATGEYVRCVKRELIVPNQRQNAMSRMGRYVSALIHTYLHNIERREPPYFERTVVSDQKLNLGQVDDVLHYVAREGQTWLVGLDEWIARAASKEYSPDGKRYGVGVYFFEVPTDRREDAESLDAAATALQASDPAVIDLVSPRSN